MNYIVYSEYEYDDFLQTPNLEPYTYLDCRNMSMQEIECRWTSDEDTVFFLGNNGMPLLGLKNLNQVWFYDKESTQYDKEQYYSLEDFIDVERFNIENSHDVFKHFRSGRFGALKNFECMKYKFRK